LVKNKRTTSDEEKIEQSFRSCFRPFHSENPISLAKAIIISSNGKKIRKKKKKETDQINTNGEMQTFCVNSSLCDLRAEAYRETREAEPPARFPLTWKEPGEKS